MTAYLGFNTGGVPFSQYAPPTMEEAASLSSRLDEKPFQPFLAHLMLQHLLPPSPSGVPQHFLARHLRARHTYLCIDPSTDPAGYFCCSGDDSTRKSVIDRLEEFAAVAGSSPKSKGGDDVADKLVRSIEYYWDGDEMMAHVEIGSAALGDTGLQLVFVWESDDGKEDGEWEWRYLDTRFLPFPVGSNTDLKHVQKMRQSNAKRSSAEGRRTTYSSKPSEENESDSGDDYWGRYDEGGSQYSGGVGRGGGHSRNSIRDAGDDAYWGQYGNHSALASPGLAPKSSFTLDTSTPGSPLGDRRNTITNNNISWVPESNVISPGSGSAEESTASLAMHLQPELGPSIESAQGLALCIDTPPPPSVSQPTNGILDSTYLQAALPKPRSLHSTKALSVSNGSLIQSLLQGHEETWNEGKRVIDGQALGYDEEEIVKVKVDGGGNGDSHDVEVPSEEAEALAGAIKGVFMLWKASRSVKGDAGDDEKRRFLRLVEKSLEFKSVV